MSRTARTHKSATPKTGADRPSLRQKERVLVEFPSALLKRADQVARELDCNRSDLIRNAVERLLDERESREFERELADAYAANSEMNLALAEEFQEIDREGFR